MQQIDAECKDKKNRLAPEIKKLRTLRAKFAEVEAEHSEQKKGYDAVQSHVESEKERMDKDIGEHYNEYKESETKFHANNIQADILEAFQQRVQHEAHFMSNPDKRLSADFKSYLEFFNAKLTQQQVIIGDLRAHQRQIKENTDYYVTQMKSFRNLQALLEIKRKTVADRGDNLVGYQDN